MIVKGLILNLNRKKPYIFRDFFQEITPSKCVTYSFYFFKIGKKEMVLTGLEFGKWFDLWIMDEGKIYVNWKNVKGGKKQ